MTTKDPTPPSKENAPKSPNGRTCRIVAHPRQLADGTMARSRAAMCIEDHGSGAGVYDVGGGKRVTLQRTKAGQTVDEAGRVHTVVFDN